MISHVKDEQRETNPEGLPQDGRISKNTDPVKEARELEFLREVFKEINGHVRATDRKSLLVSGTYITLFSVFLSSVELGKWLEPNPPLALVQMLVQIFFLYSRNLYIFVATLVSSLEVTLF